MEAELTDDEDDPTGEEAAAPEAGEQAVPEAQLIDGSMLRAPTFDLKATLSISNENPEPGEDMWASWSFYGGADDTGEGHPEYPRMEMVWRAGKMVTEGGRTYYKTLAEKHIKLEDANGAEDIALPADAQDGEVTVLVEDSKGVVKTKTERFWVKRDPAGAQTRITAKVLSPKVYQKGTVSATFDVENHQEGEHYAAFWTVYNAYDLIADVVRQYPVTPGETLTLPLSKFYEPLTRGVLYVTSTNGVKSEEVPFTIQMDEEKLPELIIHMQQLSIKLGQTVTAKLSLENPKDGCEYHVVWKARNDGILVQEQKEMLDAGNLTTSFTPKGGNEGSLGAYIKGGDQIVHALPAAFYIENDQPTPVVRLNREPEYPKQGQEVKVSWTVENPQPHIAVVDWYTGSNEHIRKTRTMGNTDAMLMTRPGRTRVEVTLLSVDDGSYLASEYVEFVVEPVGGEMKPLLILRCMLWIRTKFTMASRSNCNGKWRAEKRR